MSAKIDIVVVTPFVNTVLIYIEDNCYHGNPDWKKVKLKVFDGTGATYRQIIIILKDFDHDELKTRINKDIGDHCEKVKAYKLPMPNKYTGRFSTFWDGIVRTIRQTIRHLHRETDRQN